MAIYDAPESLHVGNGVETVFGFNWPYLLPRDLIVTVNGQPVQTVLASPNQVVVTPAPAPLAIVRIYRNTPAQNPTYLFATGIPMLPKYIDGNNKQLLFALQEGLLQFKQTQATADEALARAKDAEISAANAQASAAQQARDMRRTVRVPVTDPEIPALPDVAARANKVMGFDSWGNPVGVLPLSGSGTELAIDLANKSDTTKGAYMSGWSRSPLRRAIDSAGSALNAHTVNLWEYANYVVDKPDPNNPDTWDWTPAIQIAVDATQDTGWHLYIPRGRYPIKAAGTVVSPPYINLPYAVKVTGQLHIVNHGTIVIPMDTATKTVAFLFDGCTGGGFSGGYADGTWTDINSIALKLYSGSMVLVTRSTGVVVEDIDTTNVGGGCIVTNSYNCRIRSSRSRRTDQRVKTSAAFGVYSSRHCGIEDCSVYGGTNDGDISLYGTGFYNYVSGCKLLNYYEGDIVETVVATGGQGLCVDAGQFNASVRGNYAQGYYYGIDVKSGVSDVEVTNNRCVGNKVGIACRRGEVDSAMTTCRIADNTIIPRNGNGSTGSLGGYTTIGIFVYDAFGVTVDNNFIGVSPTSTSGAQDWCGLYASLKTPAGDSDNTLRITNNRFTFHDRLGLTYAYNLGPVMRIVGDSGARLVVKMIGNTFRLREGAATSLPFDISAFNLCEIKDNNLTGPNSSVYEYFSIRDGRQLAFNGNSAQNVGTFLMASGIRQVTINNNILGNGLSPSQPFFKLDNCGGITVNGNSKWTISGFTDGKFLEIVNQVIVNLMFAGNTIKMSNATKTNYYSINGEPGKTGDNIHVSNIFNPT